MIGNRLKLGWKKSQNLDFFKKENKLNKYLLSFRSNELKKKLKLRDHIP